MQFRPPWISAGTLQIRYYAAVSAVNQQQYMMIGWKLEITRFACYLAENSCHMFSWLSMSLPPYTRIFHMTQLKYGKLCKSITSDPSMETRLVTLFHLQFTFFSHNDWRTLCLWLKQPRQTIHDGLHCRISARHWFFTLKILCSKISTDPAGRYARFT